MIASKPVISCKPTVSCKKAGVIFIGPDCPSNGRKVEGRCESLSKEALTKVRSAEAEANAIREKANTAAQQMLELNEKLCAAQTEQQLADANAECRQHLADVQQMADRLIEVSRESAGDEAEAIRQQAESKMNEAIKVIIREMYRSCQ